MSHPNDPIDAMIRKRAARSLILNGIAPIGLALLSLCCDPFFVCTILAVLAAGATFTVPRMMKFRLEEDHLFPEGAATAGRVMGVVAIVITSAGSLVSLLLQA